MVSARSPTGFLVVLADWSNAYRGEQISRPDAEHMVDECREKARAHGPGLRRGERSRPAQLVSRRQRRSVPIARLARA